MERRFRLTFTKGEEVRYLSHLDVMRTWERTLRRARLRVAHTQGFNPRPRLVFAAPLAVGITSDAELLDIVLEEDLAADELVSRLTPALPPGMRVVAAQTIALEARPLMARVESSDYVVELTGASDPAPAVARFLASPTVFYGRSRRGASRQADMRPTVLDLWVETAGGRSTAGSEPNGGAGAAIGMRLRLDVEGLAVRPAEVVAALDPGWRVRRIHRVRLRLKEDVADEEALRPAETEGTRSAA